MHLVKASRLFLQALEACNYRKAFIEVDTPLLSSEMKESCTKCVCLEIKLKRRFKILMDLQEHSS